MTPSNSLFLRFEVEDTGVGIAAEDLPKIFEAFRQVGEKSLTMGGTGLGLAISAKLVKLMGGALQVESTLGTGSRFWFDVEFPVVTALEIGSAKPREKIIGYAGARRTILVVDDEETNRNLLLSILFPIGFRVVEAADGQECLEKALKLKPDLILLDLQMPGMDGFQTIERIRASDKLQAAKVIVISASAFEHIRAQSLDLGGNAFLAKPFQLNTLLDLLQQHMGVEWIYASDRALAEEAPPPAIEPAAIVAPPKALLISLLEALERGNPKQILTMLEEIERREAAYHPFVEKMRAFARQFQFDQAIEFLKTLV